jgi:glycosyltransferase involved in cell wall biosynthesis
VVLYSGIVVARDAVSWSLLHKLGVLRRLVERGAPLEVTVFTHSIDQPAPEIRVCPSVAKLLGRSEFWDADLHIYEEGMYYELFDSVYLVPAGRPVLAIEHNSTPAELVEVPAARVAVERSHAQRRNLLVVTKVACVSELNVEMALRVGVERSRLCVLHLPPAIVPESPPRPLSAHTGPVRLLYLGRFVRAKGITDMLDLAERLALAGGGRYQVTVAGDPRFSDSALVAAVADAERRGRVRAVLAPDDRATAALLEETDVLVIPSYHEGYCVPVVEAYGFGRPVIAYAAGNLPTIMGGLGLLAPTGDVGALEAAVARFGAALEEARAGRPLVVPTSRTDLGWDRWQNEVREHLRSYSAANFERGFLGLLRDLATKSPAGLTPGLERAIAIRLGELADSP